MNHEEAIRNQAAASYLLGDLPEAERDAFEEHYFDCRECGDTVRAGATMLVTGREVVENDSSFRRFRPLKSALTGAAAAAAIVVATYQTAVIPRVQSLATPPLFEIVRPTPFLSDATRGIEGEEQVIHFVDNKPLVLYRDIPSEAERFPRYQVEIVSAAGKALGTLDVPADIASSSASVQVKVRPLPVGRYVLAILGVREDGNRSEVIRYSVVVQ